MSFLDQIRTLAPRRQLLLAIGAAAAISAVLIVTYFILQGAPYGVLYTNLRPADAATIVSALEKKKAPYKLADGGATILVPRDRVDGARLDIANDDLPLKGTVGFELFNKSDMGLTEFAQRINYQRALQGELERTVMMMDSVDTARVHLSLADESVFQDQRRPAKASVTVVARPNRQVPDRAVRGIQRLVAAAVPDLAVDDVVVIDQRGDTLSGDATSGAPPTPLVQQKEAIELYYAARIRQALAAAVAGPVDVKVTARTEPSPTSIEGAGDALVRWTPSARGFPLDVAVELQQLPSPAAEQQIRALVNSTVGIDPTKGDIVVVSMAAAPWAGSTPPPAGLAPPSPQPFDAASAAPRLNVAVLSAFGAILALLLLAAFLLQRGRPRANLSAAEREALVRRLRAVLDAEDINAASA